MNSSVRLSVIVAVCLFLYPALVHATLQGTAHVFEFGTVEPGGFCGSLCHTYIDLGSALSEVQQPWLYSVSADSEFGTGSAVCASCHRSGGLYSTLMVNALSDSNVYGSHSHGLQMEFSNPPSGTDPSGSGLPYVDNTSGHFECTTCHDPHDDINRPFLRTDINSICARCHTKRNYIGGAEISGPTARSGIWDLANNRGTGNPGSHPVGNDVRGDTGTGPPVTIGSFFRTPFSPLPMEWSLGPHLSEGSVGGVTCLTCHAVHGVALDKEAYGDSAISYPPNLLYLAVSQAPGTVNGYSRTVANGSGETNTLCEACHGDGNSPSIAPGGSPWSHRDNNVHPGQAGLFSHPTDSYPASTGMGVDNFPPGWPKGDPSIAGQNVSPVPICETCHVPHPEAALMDGRSDVITGAGAFILRAPVGQSQAGTIMCDNCHNIGIKGHHPINRPYDSSGVPYLQNVRAGAGDLLACSTCHFSAHNWNQPGWAGLDPSWLPLDNGRDIVQVEDMYHPDMSKTCMDCHYFMDGDGSTISPTLGTAQSVIDPSDEEYEHFQISEGGMGTHYIGRIHEEEDELDWINKPIIDMFNSTTTWKEQDANSEYGEHVEGLAEGWSRFGGENIKDSRAIVCESCHELEPDKNRTFKHLLLAPYQEGRNGVYEYAGDDDGRDILCESCHGNPEGSHPMSGDIVSRTDEVIDIHGQFVRENILGYATVDELWGDGMLSCDSCHQPHDANSHSRTYIVDVPDTLPEAGIKGQAIRENTAIEAYGELINDQTNYREANGSPGTYTTPRYKNVTFTGNCLQCHDK